ncbi:FecR family protein [Aestuariibaculum marinum]|uniref:DUF4974 domain-containing protein n=1 Tax=Aestuariibaculum marinum TaxID=2683592 RepID=A0A8J6Q4Y3_9FLAO|nr:FecR domain-containing protein [Aestuariibaculum marinum]MBD0825480.1 DUF4974 domain-containing protein [Aestuariibaculum marinum]
MKQKKARKIIIKTLSGKASNEELDRLLDWVEEDEANMALFKKYLDVYQFYDIQQKFEAEKSFNNLMSRLKKKQSSGRIISMNYQKYLAATAAACLVIFLTYFFQEKNYSVQQDDNSEIEISIQAGTNKAILTLDNGEVVKLIEGETYENNNVKGDGYSLLYGDTILSKKEYNTLTVPRGGQYYLVLSDGTKVWLNSESQLKFPVQFVKGETRSVELAYGEAYFDVTSSKHNNGASFSVENKNQIVEVLGTQFNIKAYKEEPEVYTTLVEGAVSVENELGSEILSPNQQLIVDINSKNINIKTVDTYPFVAWKSGVFNFREMELQSVVQVLSRWYDVDIIIKDEDVKRLKFNGLLRKNQDLGSVLKVIAQSINLKFKKYENQIILEK